MKYDICVQLQAEKLLSLPKAFLVRAPDEGTPNGNLTMLVLRFLTQ